MAAGSRPAGEIVAHLNLVSDVRHNVDILKLGFGLGAGHHLAVILANKLILGGSGSIDCQIDTRSLFWDLAAKRQADV